MMDTIVSILGKYVFDGFSLILTFLESQLSIALFCGQVRKRNAFFLRLAIVFLEGIILAYLLAIWNTEAQSLLVRVVCYLLIALYNFLFLLFCWEDTLEELLIAFSCGLAAYQIGNKVYPLLQNLLGIDDKATLSLVHSDPQQLAGWEWLLFFAIRIGIYFLLVWIFRPRGRLTSDRRTRRNIVLLSVSTVAIVTVLVCIARTYEGESMALNIVIKLFAIIFSLVVLMFGRGIFSQNEKEQQINVLNQLMKQEKLQYESVKANMEVINMKCHDLKHILHRIEGKLTGEETDALREAIQFYDANIKTGNDILDIVLCEKAMVCRKKGIAFTCLADGPKFAFLSPVQIYSLFGNILDNAIEAAEKRPDLQNKVITLTCHENGGQLEIEESNYFDGAIRCTDGSLSTMKDDSARHGYGTKSIRYIAEQHGGRLEVRVEGNMFFLSVLFPVQK